jgi:hypothetical protein
MCHAASQELKDWWEAAADLWTPGVGRPRLTTGPFGDSISAAARPKRRGVSRQVKGQELDPTKFELFTLLT